MSRTSGVSVVGAGSTLNPRGAWAASTAYAVNDAVEFSGSTFRCVTAHTSSSVFQSQFVAGDWERWAPRDGWADIRDFNAKVDASTDDGAAIQAAIDSLGASGGTVFVPPGTTVTGRQIVLKNQVTLRGGGRGASILKVATNANLTTSVITNFIGNGTSVATAERCGVYDLMIDGNKNNQASGTCHGVILDSSANPASGQGEFFDTMHTIQNVRVYKANGDGVHLANRSGTMLHNVLVEQSNGYGFYSTFDTLFFGCQAGQNGQDGFNLHNGSIRCVGCKAYLNGQGTFSTAQDYTAVGFRVTTSGGVALVGCEAQNNNAQGFYISTSKVTTAGCSADANGFSVLGGASAIGGALTGDTHSSTTVDNVSQATFPAGVLVVGAAITGTGIPANTTVSAWSANTITLSQAATATAAGVTLTVNHPPHVAGYTLDAANNCVVQGISTVLPQGGVQVGWQDNALDLINGSTSNHITLSHAATAPATTSTALSAASTLLANTVILNGSITNPAVELQTNKGQASGYASLDGSGLVPSAQLPPGSGTPLLFGNGFFGDGSDGTAVLDGANTFAFLTKAGNVYTLQRDTYFARLTVNTGITLRAAGSRIYCSGLVDGAGTIHANGNNAAGATGGAAPSANTIKGGTVGVTGTTGAGGNGTAVNPSWGGSGGNGGSATAGATAGGTGGVATVPGASQPLPRVLPFATSGWAINGAGTSQALQGGAPGASGGGDGSNAGGGGGSSGAPLICNLKTVSGTLTFSSVGGNGGNGAGGTAGGGGGGGGGVVVVNTTAASGQTLTAAAGTHGNGVSTGANGVDGSAGVTYLNVFS